MIERHHQRADDVIEGGALYGRNHHGRRHARIELDVGHSGELGLVDLHERDVIGIVGLGSVSRSSPSFPERRRAAAKSFGAAAIHWHQVYRLSPRQAERPPHDPGERPSAVLTIAEDTKMKNVIPCG